ncbi:MAG: hypothetical protein IIA07_10115 [Proteobacteria bacterium]|nr:hypothetical protein [Pseudomonadota bacterium]
MTLIASYQRNDVILMIGDLAVSDDKLRDVPIDIPTRFSRFQPLTNSQFCSLQQKIIIVNPHFAVGWSGSRIIARFIIKFLRKNLATPYSADQILRLIEDSGLKPSDLEKVSFIFFLFRPDEEKVEIQDYRTGETIMGHREKVKYAGSGAFHFFDTIAFDILGTDGQLNETEKVIAVFLSRISIVLFEEITTDITHNFYYGGGFEMIGCNGPAKRFEKIPLSYVFWTFDDESLNLCGPIFAQNYTDDVRLIITRLAKDEAGAWQARSFLIRNLLHAHTDDRVPARSRNFDTPFCVHYFIPRTSSANFYLMIKKGDEKGFSIEFSESTNKLKMHVSERFQNEARALCEGRLPA